MSNYGMPEIIIFGLFLIMALKEGLTYFDWYKNRIDSGFISKYKKTKQNESVLKDLQEMKATLEEIAGHISILDDKIDSLTNAEKEDIKADLTKDHHYFCYQKGWIDDYSLECCEKKYAFYKEHKGNSFIAGFMEELRALPKVPPQK